MKAQQQVGATSLCVAPVTGEVSLVRNHSVIELSSYVKPPDVETGSVMISAVIGHT